MQNDPEQLRPTEQSHRFPLTDTPVLPFDIDAYLPKRSRSWPRSRRPAAASYSIDDLTISISPRRARTLLNAKTWQVLKTALALFVVFGIGGYRIWLSQASYPGTEQCYQAELWLHGVDSDLSWIRWTLEDAAEEVTNETEAETSNDQVWQMYEDMHTSLARIQAPAEVALIKTLLIQGLGLLFEIRKADQQGDTATSNRLSQELDKVIAQRLEEQRRVLHSCRIAVVAPAHVVAVGGSWHIQAA